MRYNFFYACIAGMCLLSGCRPQFNEGTGIELKGMVYLDGKPVTMGMVQLYPYNGISTSGNASTTNINSDGSYSLPNLSQGNMKVVVRTSHLKAQMAAKGKKNAQPTKGVGAPVVDGSFIEIPSIYEDPDKTTINVDLSDKGTKTFDIELKSSK